MAKSGNEVDSLRAERNALSKRIPTLDRATKNDAVEKVKAIKEKLSDLEKSLSEMKLEFDDLMLKVPSIPATEVPIGKDETDNVEIRRWCWVWLTGILLISAIILND